MKENLKMRKERIPGSKTEGSYGREGTSRRDFRREGFGKKNVRNAKGRGGIPLFIDN